MQSDHQENTKSPEELTEKKSDSPGDHYSWVNIGTTQIQLNSFIGRNRDVYALSIAPTPNQVWRYNELSVDSNWNMLSKTAKSIGVTADKMYIISTNGQTIWENNPKDESWTQILDIPAPAPPATQLISGGNQIYYIHDLNGFVFKYQNTQNFWNLLDLKIPLSLTPYSKYVATGDSFVGLNETTIYTFISGQWTSINGTDDTSSFIDIVGGNSGEFYGVSSTYNLYIWGGSLGWIPTGSQDFSIHSTQYVSDPLGLFGIVLASNALDRVIYKYHYSVLGKYWQKLDVTWPKTSQIEQYKLYNDSGYVANQPILADSNASDRCYLLRKP